MNSIHDGFLVLHRRAARVVGSVAALEELCGRFFGRMVECVPAGEYLVVRTGHTALRDGQHSFRLGHGTAGVTVDSNATYVDWRNAQLGGFAAMEINKVTGKLVVARDRFGAVPIFVRHLADGIAISSSWKLLRALAEDSTLDELALLETVRFRWQSGRRTLALDISQLAPGEELAWHPGDSSPRITRWSKLEFHATGSTSLSLQAERLQERLGVAITEHFRRSARPAILLSGGVDSSVIAAIARDVRPDVRCFIAHVDGVDGLEEGRRARFVANRLGLPLEEVYIDTSRFAADLLQVAALLEEPPRNPNNLILLQLYRAMQEAGVDCVLNGDGAEMILGLADTERVARFASKARLLAPVPMQIRRGIARWLRHLDASTAWRIAALLDTPRATYSAVLDELDYPPAIKRAVRTWMANVAGDHGTPWSHLLESATVQASFEDALHEYQCYTVLLSSQRRHECLARAHGVEAATPFTHQAILEFSAELPRSLRYTTRSRPVLKHLCDTLIHPDVADWPKLGFSVPWRGWLDHQLAPLIQEARNTLGTSEVLPVSLRSLVHSENSAEWRWTILSLHLILSEHAT